MPEASLPHEAVRAGAGAAVCDKRRDIAVAEVHFPGVDFSHIEPGVDTVYEQHRVESEHAVMERGARFLQWLMARRGRPPLPPPPPPWGKALLCLCMHRGASFPR